MAAILSVVESCRRLGLPVKHYLQSVPPEMARRNLSQIAPFTPARWSASRNEHGLVGRLLAIQEAAAVCSAPEERERLIAKLAILARCGQEKSLA